MIDAEQWLRAVDADLVGSDGLRVANALAVAFARDGEHTGGASEIAARIGRTEGYVLKMMSELRYHGYVTTEPVLVSSRRRNRIRPVIPDAR